MRHLLHILLLLLTLCFGASCQDAPVQIVQHRSSQVTIQTRGEANNWLRTGTDVRFREGLFTNAPSLCRTVSLSEETAESHSGSRTTPTVRGGGKAFSACRAPRSTLHQLFGGFAQRTTVPIRSFASHLPLFYVLRHIVR